MQNIPTITKNLLIINLLIFLVTYMYGGQMMYDGQTDYALNNLFGLYFVTDPNFHIYQFLTYMFMHGSWTHVILNMFMLWMFGAVIEQVLGAKRFLFYYLFCGVGAGLVQEVVQLATGSIVSSTVGASGAIYSLLLAFGMMFPEQRMFIIPIPIPIKAKWMVIGSVVVELLSEFTPSGDGVAHMAHLGGMLFGYLLIRYWKKHPDVYDGSCKRKFYNNVQNQWTRKKWHSMKSENTSKGTASGSDRQQDWDYNAGKRAAQEEIDRILDKIRKSGYESLTNDEKQRLFDQSRKK